MQWRLPILLVGLAACDGSAPAVAPPPALGSAPPCSANAPPPGYRGPVSPFTGPCLQTPTTTARPAEMWDYSQGQPPRAVRGQVGTPTP